MTLQSDCSVGLKKESTYGTAVVVDHFPEFLEQSLQQKPEFLQGEGLRVGKVLPRFARRALGKVVCEGDIELEVATKNFSIFLEAALGACTATLRSGSIYQHVATPLATDPMPAYTVQVGVPPVGGGTTIAQTFVGAVCDEWEISAKAGEIAMWKSSWVAKEMLTATAYAAPSYVASPRLLTFQHAALSIGVNGTHALTVPTATALGATAATANASVTEFSVKGKNNVDDGGYVVGSAGKRGRRPTYGMRELGGSFTAEFVDTALRDLYIAQSHLHGVLTLTSDQDNIAGGGTYAALQIVIPSLVLEGDIPTSNKGDLITQKIDWTGLDGESAASPLYMVLVTSDTAV